VCQIDERRYAACGGSRNVFQTTRLGIRVVCETDMIDGRGEAVLGKKGQTRGVSWMSKLAKGRKDSLFDAATR
jgi:hypothetical protein